jgi:GNAT superfamily N-acetyltransferase
VLVVRPASADEVREVQLQVLRPGGPLPGDTPHPPDWLHVAADVDGQVVGGCSVGPSVWRHPDACGLPAPAWQLRSMAVLPRFRGGVGAELLRVAVERAWAGGAASMWADARQEALGLYVRGGWRVVGDPWLKPGVGPHRHVVLMRFGCGSSVEA